MAKRTYTGTWMRPDLTEAKIDLYISRVNRYERGSRIYMADEEPEDEEKLELTGVKSWSIIEGGPEAEGCARWLGEKDDNDEYLVITFADGRFDVYRNSYVTMFIW